MTPRRPALPEAQLRPLLRETFGVLGPTNGKRLMALLPLFAGDGKARIGECLKTAFPGLATADAQEQFRVFRAAVNTAAAKAKSGLTFQVDTRKRSGPEARECWFEHADRSEEKLAALSRESVADVRLIDPVAGQIENSAVLTTVGELTLPPLVRIFVSYASKDRAVADRLLDLLTDYFKAAKDYRFEIWRDVEGIRLHEKWDQRIKAELERAHIGLLLLSPAFFASDYIQKYEWPYFRDRKKPFAALELRGELDHLNLAGLEECQRFSLKGRDGRSHVPFKEAGTKKEKFASAFLAEFKRTVDELNGRNLLLAHGATPANASEITAAVARKVGEQLGKFCAELANSEPLKVFVEPKVRPVDLKTLASREGASKEQSGESASAFAELERWACDPEAAPFYAVLGEVGIGKTTTLKCLTQRLLDRWEKDRASPLPIFVDLRAYYAQSANPHEVPTLEQILRTVIERHWKGGNRAPLHPDEIVRAVQQDGALIIFDGLDEKIVHLRPESARQFIRELWRVLPPGLDETRKNTTRGTGRRGKMILSCRSHYFKDVWDQNSMLTGERRDGVREENYRACLLLPFDEGQIRDYLTQALGDAAAAERALELFASVHNLRELAQRPFLLALMVREIEMLERRKARGDVVLGVTLYDLLVEGWLHRDNGKHHFSPEHKIVLMERLAADLFRDGAREWPWKKISDWLGRFLANRPDIVVWYRNKDPELLNEDFRTATFALRPDGAQEGFRFAHTSLQEYFLARHLVGALETGQPDGWKLETLPTLETLDFVGQLLTERRDSRLAKALGSLLTRGEPLAARVALRYWLLAFERGYPEPELDNKPAQLARLDLEKWTIRGRPGNPLPLGGANLAGARLDYSRWEHVYLADADFSGASCGVAEFVDVNLSRAALDGADFAGAVFRDCGAEGLRGAKARWHEAEWSRCDLRGADLGADFGLHGATALSDGTENLPRGLTAELGTIIRSGHGGTVTSCAWSPDGRWLASASYDQTVRLWDAETGKCLLVLAGHRDLVNVCSWSPDGDWLASGSTDNTVRVWDTESGKCLRTLAGHNGEVGACAWSPDGRRLASGADDNTVRVWDVESGSCSRILAGHDGGVRACAWFPDGRRLMSACGKMVRVWDTESSAIVGNLSNANRWMIACERSQGGFLVAFGGLDEKLSIWDAESGKCVRKFVAEYVALRCTWSPDGRRLMSRGVDSAARIWHIASGRCLRTLTGHTDSLRECVWSPDGRRVATASEDKTVRVWDAESGQCLRILDGRENRVRTCAWSPDGRRLVSWSGNKTVRVWDAESGKCIRTQAFLHSRVHACAWSPDGRRFVTAGGLTTVQIWDTETEKCVYTLASAKIWVKAFAWSPDGRRFASGSGDNTVHVWDAESGKCLRTLAAGHEDEVLACGWSPDGRRLASASGDTVRVWEIETGKCIRPLVARKNRAKVCEWSSDGRRLVTGGSDQTVRVWDAESGKCLHTLVGHEGEVRACAWAPDGRRFASGSGDSTMRVWDAETGQCLCILSGHENGVYACAWSPDGRRIASGSGDSTMRVWDAQTGKCEWALGHFHDGEAATLDLVKNKFLWASPGAWRHLGWRVFDPETKRTRILPAEFCGALPE